jgi:hypothetical protein
MEKKALGVALEKEALGPTGRMRRDSATVFGALGEHSGLCLLPKIKFRNEYCQYVVNISLEFLQCCCILKRNHYVAADGEQL